MTKKKNVFHKYMSKSGDLPDKSNPAVIQEYNHTPSPQNPYDTSFPTIAEVDATGSAMIDQSNSESKEVTDGKKSTDQIIDSSDDLNEQIHDDVHSILTEAGYDDAKFIATATKEEINSITGIPESRAKRIIHDAQLAAGFEFQTAATIMKEHSQSLRISTGSAKLDEIIGGGIEPKCITEFYGAFTTGKTQVCIQLAVNVALPQSHGGLASNVIYIDTEGSFRPERVVQICNGLEVDPKPVLDRILVGRAHNSDIQMQLAGMVVQLAKDKNVKLLIVDSLTSTFRAEFIGKNSLIERQQKLNQHVRQLSRIADLLNIGLVVTNQVSAIINGFENTVVPIGGNIVGHGSTHRLHFIKSTKYPSVRYAKLVASPSLPDGEAMFEIRHEGIGDIDMLELGSQ